MFNTTIYKQQVDIKPAYAGTLQKSSERSFFVRCHVRSGMAESLFDKHAKYCGDYVQVLQVMLFGDEQMLAELLPEPKE